MNYSALGALATTRFLPQWLSEALYPFGFCVRRTIAQGVKYNRRIDEYADSCFTTIPDLCGYRQASFILTSNQKSGFVVNTERVYSRAEILVAVALVDAWVSDSVSVSRSETNKWYEGLKAGLFLDGENLYMLDLPVWSQDWRVRLRQNNLECPVPSPTVILYANEAREPLAQRTRIRPFPWQEVFRKGLVSGLKQNLVTFLDEPFYCRKTHWLKGVYLDA